LLLTHSSVAAPSGSSGNPRGASHTLPEDVGKIATQAGVKTLVLSHFVPGDDASITDEQWAEGVRKHFKGQVIVGKDLMEI